MQNEKSRVEIALNLAERLHDKAQDMTDIERADLILYGNTYAADHILRKVHLHFVAIYVGVFSIKDKEKRKEITSEFFGTLDGLYKKVKAIKNAEKKKI